MKRLVILLLIVCPLMANAQVKLLPMLEEGKSWDYTYPHWDDEGKYRKYWVSYTLRGDTVIDGREYMKMYRYDQKDRQTNYFGAFREDEEGRVWKYDPYAKSDFIICDVTCASFSDANDEPAQVDMIDIWGQLLHRFRRNGYIGVEGVGHYNSGIVRVPGLEASSYTVFEELEYVTCRSFTFFKQNFMAPTHIELTENEKKMVEQNNDFAFNLFRKARTGESKVLSPLSITYALGMLNNGTVGKTQQEIYDVLGFDDADAQNAFCRKLTDGLQMAGSVDITTKSMLSNTIFVNIGRGFELEPDFANAVNQYYDASPQARNFADGQTRDVINQWASDHTEGMIREVLSESEFNPSSVSYLLNATYFKGMWSSRFKKENTWDEPFAGGEKVPMMHQELEAEYYENNLYQTVKLPYGNGTYNMQVFLPREGKTLDEVIESLNGKNWLVWGESCTVDLSLPRFETDTDQDLVGVMSQLGMPTAFNPLEADLSRMLVGDADEDDYIGLMKQVAKIKLDEKGTEAAAVTAIDITEGMPEYAEFHASRPFFYIISEQSTGVILFMGQYMGNHPEGKEDPTDEFYRPFVEEGKVWTYHYHGYNGREFNVDRVMDGDTIIGGQTYKKIYDKIGGQYLYALRENGKKVYIVSNEAESLLDETGTESLLYDFSKDVGDVIDELEYPLIVASVDTIDIDGVKFRRMRVQDANQPIEEWNDEMINMYNFWIEGVGSECLLESSIREPGNDYNLLSCQINGRVYTQQELLATNPKKIGLDQYLPFVQAGKRWTVNQSYVGKENLDEMTYTLSYNEVSENGNQYYDMPRSLNGNLVDDEPFMIREKNRKVYLHFPYTEYEYLLFDYSLKAGDTYWTYSLDEQKAVEYEVLSVSDFTDGPEFVYREYDEKGDSMKTYVRYLRKWVVERTDKPIQKTWIEGVGSLEGPLANFYDAARTSGRDYLAYVELGRLDYLPFEFNDTVNYRWHGCNLPTGAEDNWEEDFHKLTYELEGDRLHVYGEALTQCGPNNYAYFKEEPTDDPLTYRIRFYIQEVEPTMDCMALHATNFYVSGFNPNLNYIIVDNHGEEHPVINRTPQMAYRPFVEEGKVWKVGNCQAILDNSVHVVDYYYFDGDTIIDGKTCKQMMCQRFVSPGFSDEYGYWTPQPFLRKVGAWYEEDQKVYFYDETTQSMVIKYDFSLGDYETVDFLYLDGYPPYIIGPKQTGGIEGFKGVYRDIMMGQDINTKTPWLEGVGGLDGPFSSVYHPLADSKPDFLMSCVVGDEVIYLNDRYEDGATPESVDAKKRRFDFNHTVKTQPKTPNRRGEEAALYGEYNDKLLDIRLDPLDDAYVVRITNQKTGETLYEKAINAGNIVALNIDISKYPEGQYEITIDNSNETFNGVIDTTTGIDEIVNGKSLNSKSIYNLQGQRMNSLQKGFNIIEGKKIFVK